VSTPSDQSDPKHVQQVSEASQQLREAIESLERSIDRRDSDIWNRIAELADKISESNRELAASIRDQSKSLVGSSRSLASSLTSQRESFGERASQYIGLLANSVTIMEKAALVATRSVGSGSIPNLGKPALIVTAAAVIAVFSVAGAITWSTMLHPQATRLSPESSLLEHRVAAYSELLRQLGPDSGGAGISTPRSREGTTDRWLHGAGGLVAGRGAREAVEDLRDFYHEMLEADDYRMNWTDREREPLERAIDAMRFDLGVAVTKTAAQQGAAADAPQRVPIDP